MLPLRDNVPTRTFPVVTVGLIAANVLVWFWELLGTSVDYDVIHYGYYPCTVEGPCVAPAPADPLSPVASAFTSMFMHGGWLHIAGNMLFLWIFGNNVEDSLGRVRFLLWYLFCGLGATALQTIVTLYAGTAQDASIPNIGASGAIAGVLGGYFVLPPRAKVLTAVILIFFFFLIEIPAIVFLGIWFLFQAVEGGFTVVQPQTGGGVAFFAHVGGFIVGLLTIKLVVVRKPLAPTY
jgi:membrane associated rhomboid family serine protease